MKVRLFQPSIFAVGFFFFSRELEGVDVTPPASIPVAETGSGSHWREGGWGDGVYQTSAA